MEKRCGRCGNVAKKDTKYCQVCGTLLEKSDHIDLPADSKPSLFISKDNPSVIYDDHITIGNKVPSVVKEKKKRNLFYIVLFLIVFSAIIWMIIIPTEYENTENNIDNIIDETSDILEESSYTVAESFCKYFYEEKNYDLAKELLLPEYLTYEEVMTSIDKQIEATKDLEMSCEFVEQTKMEDYDLRGIKKTYKEEIGNSLEIQDAYKIEYNISYLYDDSLQNKTNKFIVIKINDKWYIW